MSLLAQLSTERVASRIAARDPSVFAGGTPSAAVRDAIANRLGWIDAPDAMAQQAATDLSAFVDEVRQDRLTHVCLLGMGGSSLCAEVLRDTAPGGRRERTLVVLDTTDERAIDDVAAALAPAETLFLVASKSGTTVEVDSLERYFGSLVSRAVGEGAGRHFVAITDPGTPLVAHARAHGYRRTFVNPPDIGGRYSALSLFGLVPAALVGLDTARLLAEARAMAARCRADGPGNPGVALGAFMAGQAAAGRDKLTLLLPTALAPLGAWIEQLVAESTGKDGRGLLPVIDEPAGAPAEYGDDRAFVLVESAESGALDAHAQAVAGAGHPVFRLSPEGLGAEFFRWEFATAVAGAALGINPFDEPNVREAKARTQTLIDAYRASGALHVDPPLKPIDGVPGCLAREHRGTPAGSGRYVALLDYLPADPARVAAIQGLRNRIRRRTRWATTHGVGPRYLHSTGQYHKGGPNTGVFVLLTAPDATASAVPGTDYTFSVLKQAQALGDFDALAAAGREVVHLHVEAPPADLAEVVEQVLEQRGVLP
jgi:glucose-6-phosphate isomerase